VFSIEKTPAFDKWLRKLKDLKAKAKILFKIQKIGNDEHFGDSKPVGEGIKEMRINFSKGYRIYNFMFNELYEIRNAYLHSGMKNEYSDSKIKLIIPIYINTIRSYLLDKIENGRY